jgi:SAM-dependent methyltransferase
MADLATRHYTLHGEHECDRLELQARIAGIGDHIRYMRIPGRANILDAGCGSGSMARLLASRNPDATVIGFDLNGGYLDYARRIAANEGLANISFREGDIQALPFADASFDLIWSKHVLFFVPRIEDALREFRRTLMPGRQVVNCPRKLVRHCSRSARSRITRDPPPGAGRIGRHFHNEPAADNVDAGRLRGPVC